MRPDKQKVIDERWDEARIASFLDKAPLGDEGPDYSALLHAYRSMRPEDFARFIELFRTAGRDLTARGRDGLTLREHIAGHARSQAFRDILQAAGG